MKGFSYSNFSVIVDSPIRKFSREKLFSRHRLSHQQIDELLGENQAKFQLEDKIRQMADLKVFFELTDKLREKGIFFLNLKGPVLSQRIYGDPTYRYYKDFDILVNPEDMQKALAVMKELGFKSYGYEWPISRSKQRNILKFLNQINYYHEPTGVSVELHWKIFHWEVMKPGKLKDIIQENLTTVQFGGREFKVLSKELELLYLMIHGALHAWARLKWLLDIYEILKREKIDLDTFEYWGKLFKVQVLIASTNEILQKFFPDSPQLPFKEYLDKNTLDCPKERINSEVMMPDMSKSEVIRYFKYKWKIIPRWNFRKSLFKFSDFKKEEVEHSWMPLHPIFVLSNRIVSKVFN
jgi:hypothetical protein